MSDSQIRVFQSDISNDLYKALLKEDIIAWDIETSGLYWTTSKIATCQIYNPSTGVVIVRVEDKPPKRLLRILSNRKIRKVFHYAPFDLTFMMYIWNVEPRYIACTKIASKLLGPANKKYHSLKSLVKLNFGVNLDKRVRLSNWFIEELTQSQIQYAAQDVIYLIPLLNKLEKQINEKGLLNLAYRIYEFIPTRVQLDILGYKDIYLH